MVDGAGPRPRHRWNLGVVALAAAAVAVVAWVVREAVESANIPYDTERQWPAFWATAVVGLAAVLVFANRRPSTPKRALKTTAAAGGAFVAMLVLVVFVGLTMADCGVSPESASWKDKSLHELLRDGGDHHGNPVTVAAPLQGFAFRDPDLDARWSDYSLHHAAWGRGIGYDFGPTALVAEPGIVRAAYVGLDDLRAHRAEVLDFLQGLGAMAEDATRIAQSMEANATSGEKAAQRWPHGEGFVEYHAAIPVGWSPQAAWDSFCCIGQQPADDGSHAADLGFADLRVGHWSFLFALETKRLQGNGFTLATDAEGRVEFEGLSTGQEDEDEYKGKVKRTLKALALPEPRRESMAVGGSIC